MVDISAFEKLSSQTCHCLQIHTRARRVSVTEFLRSSNKGWYGVQVNRQEAAVVALAATVANLFESWLGATVQGRISWLTNDLVNVIQISLAAAIAITARYFFLA